MLKRLLPYAVLLLAVGLMTDAVQADEELADLVREVKPAVVTVLAYNAVDSPFPAGRGTGFFVTPERLVTNWHVVRGAKKLEFRDHEGNVHEVTGLAGKSIKHDVAVLVAADGFEAEATFDIADSLPDMGSSVYALGSPLGLEYTLSGIETGTLPVLTAPWGDTGTQDASFQTFACERASARPVQG